MRIHTYDSGDDDQINMTPLIDMVFLLLIFFLVATTISKEERDAEIQLPTASALQPLSAPPPQFVINIREDGSIKVVRQTMTIDELGAALRKMAKDEPNREVLIRADMNSYHKYFASVARTAREAGIGAMKIGYIIEGSAGQDEPK